MHWMCTLKIDHFFSNSKTEVCPGTGLCRNSFQERLNFRQFNIIKYDLLLVLFFQNFFVLKLIMYPLNFSLIGFL